MNDLANGRNFDEDCDLTVERYLGSDISKAAEVYRTVAPLNTETAIA